MEFRNTATDEARRGRRRHGDVSLALRGFFVACAWRLVFVLPIVLLIVLLTPSSVAARVVGVLLGIAAVVAATAIEWFVRARAEHRDDLRVKR